MFSHLFARCPAADRAVIEIGPGTGQATERLLAERPASLLAIEPDPRLAGYLARRYATARPALTILDATFEAAFLPRESADLILSATAFHWLDQATALRKAFELLRPGGWLALCWNVFADIERPDAFHQASRELWRMLPSTRSWGDGAGKPFPLDAAARLHDLRDAGFADLDHWSMVWTVDMSTAQILALSATFSQVSQAAPALRTTFLQSLADLTDRRFGGRVERRFTTTLYCGRRN